MSMSSAVLEGMLLLETCVNEGVQANGKRIRDRACMLTEDSGAHVDSFDSSMGRISRRK